MHEMFMYVRMACVHAKTVVLWSIARECWIVNALRID